MAFCTQCGTTVPGSARFCPACGAEQSSMSQMATAVSPAGSAAPVTPSIPIGRLDSSSSSAGAFAPGAVLGGRYRIIGLLGRGGMGEVYRADDLRLGQPVSLKFLPRSLASKPALLERFNAEVRHARQVSHPNVCRVYDIGEIDGQSFLTMEYVDGEDLATLLRRIGRLPAAKANEVARQLCAGLYAAHEQGVLHRDLKPSNVMIDNEGRARITDFGLAVRSDETVAGDTSGTPAYMAPEQFEGGAATERSDLYSLGLILYEMYTGQRPFEAASAAEWRTRHTRAEPTLPSAVDAGIDDAVERAILRCLEKDPSRRPSSALQLASALPGGNPLAEALAAGETPSPEMVAAAGGEGGSAPRAAWVKLLGVVVTIVAILMLSPYSSDLGLAPYTNSADVLRDRARDVLATAGLTARPQDSDSWLQRDYVPIHYLSVLTPSTWWRRHMAAQGPPISFTYRQSPRWMENDWTARVAYDDPAYEVSGMGTVTLDGKARLRLLRIVPPQLDSTATAASPPDWAPLFRDAGLDAGRFHAVVPIWLSPEAFDTRSEWTGPAPWDSSTALRVSAAGFHGKPVYFEVFGPWSRPQRMLETKGTTSASIAGAMIPIAITLMLVVGVFFARRNLALGRGDRRGALRLAWFLFVMAMLSFFLRGHHLGDFSLEFGTLIASIARALLASSIISMLYLALEPYVRRRMPELLIGWARLLEGRTRDPRIGRDVMIGAWIGSLVALVVHVTNALPTWIPFLGQTPLSPNVDAMYGGRRFLAVLFSLPINTLVTATLLFSVLFVLRVVLRQPRLAVAGLMVFITLSALGGENFALETPGAVVMGALMTLALARFGLLTAVTATLFQTALTFIPLPLDFTAPYATSTIVTLVVLLALTLYAFRISLGSQKLFTLED